ncbi:MAG: hypothetical protein ACRDVN_02105 [Jiangellaceae bacterium]
MEVEPAVRAQDRPADGVSIAGQGSAGTTPSAGRQALQPLGTTVRRRSWRFLLLALAVAAAAAMRLRFAGVPLTADEAGYGVVAGRWADGASLYGDAWVDRPQALVLLYRVAWESGPTGVRVLALVATAVTALGVAWAARTLAGRNAALAAAGLYLLVSPAPRLEGWAANGELLAGAFTTLGIAGLLAWRKAGRTSGGLLAAGMLLVSTAPLVKQSAVEGLLVAVVLVAPHARSRLPALGWAVLPWVVAVVHGGSVGFDRWWFAVVGYRFHGDPAAEGVLGRLELFWQAVPPLVLDAAPLLAVGLVCLSRLGRRHSVFAAWLAGGLVGVVGGGLFHTHYWLQLLPLGAVAAGVAWARMPRRVVPAVVAGIVVLAVGWAPFLATDSPAELVTDATGDLRLASAERVGHELAELSDPDERVLVVWAAASVYAYADREPATPFLWFRPVRYIDGASEAIIDQVAGDDPPAAIAVAQPPELLDPDGGLSRLLEQRYQRVATVDGIPVYALRE